METTATANNKHSATAGEINIKPSTVVLFTIVLVIEYIISHHKKFQSMLEDKKILSEEKNQVLKQDSDMIPIWNHQTGNLKWVWLIC